MARLLVVEDDQSTAQVVSLCLAGAGHQVHEVFSTSEALRSADACPPDAVVLDAGLPDEGSLKVVTLCRNLANHPPVVLMTRRGCERDCQRLLQAGATKFVVKSEYFHNNLVEAVGQALAGGRTGWAVAEA